VNVPKVFQNPQMDQGPGSNVIVGAVVALPLGAGSEKPFVGGVGTPEMRERFTETTYEIVIRLDDGGFTQVQRADGASYRVGERVRVQGTQLELLTP
jgi:outer membrane lipoprotein SlyB